MLLLRYSDYEGRVVCAWTCNSCGATSPLEPHAWLPHGWRLDLKGDATLTCIACLARHAPAPRG